MVIRFRSLLRLPETGCDATGYTFTATFEKRANLSCALLKNSWRQERRVHIVLVGSSTLPSHHLITVGLLGNGKLGIKKIGEKKRHQRIYSNDLLHIPRIYPSIFL